MGKLHYAVAAFWLRAAYVNWAWLLWRPSLVSAYVLSGEHRRQPSKCQALHTHWEPKLPRAFAGFKSSSTPPLHTQQLPSDHSVQRAIYSSLTPTSRTPKATPKPRKEWHAQSQFWTLINLSFDVDFLWIYELCMLLCECGCDRTWVMVCWCRTT